MPGLEIGRVAEILVTLGTHEPGRRGSGYRVTAESVLTAAHVVRGGSSVRVRFDADQPGEWSADATAILEVPGIDVALLTITPPDAAEVIPAQFGRITECDTVIECSAAGFPLWKLRDDPSGRYRDSAHVVGSIAPYANRREGTLEITVPPPGRDPDPKVSPWEGMSGAAVFCNSRIVGIISQHHRSDGPGRLAAIPIGNRRQQADSAQQERLRKLLGIADDDGLADVVPAPRGSRTWTGYIEQVRDIAPAGGLLDREAELLELAAFCVADESYVWWQAGPWAGKTALMSTFVLNPPAGVDVVSFFITARLASQNDSTAFTDALLDQLAVLAGEALPPSLITPTARDAHRRALLRAAAVRSQQSGRPLVLVIDGLDEDRGSIPGSGLASIASLLPKVPESGVRVIVAGRPSPEVPSDVPGDHPLRTCRIRPLDTSPHATEIIRLARRELDELLTSDRAHRDVIGFISASGGGLTVPDLEELTAQPRYLLDGMLGGAFGRTIAGRTDPSTADRERVLLFAHDTLRAEAADRLGAVFLDRYRGYIHSWADTYRRDWPAATPLYLLLGYSQMLADLLRDRPDAPQADADLQRLVALATDGTRHGRIRQLTGGDAAALTEVTNAQAAILARSNPNLLAMIRLAIHRTDLSSRNARIPLGLPVVLARVGQFARAEALTCSITDRYARVEAMASLMQVAAEAGDRECAARLAATAQALASGIADHDDRVRAAAVLAGWLTVSGRAHEAEAVARSVTDQEGQAEVYAVLIPALATNGEPARAEIIADSLTDSGLRAQMLSTLALTAAEAGDRDRAATLAGRAQAAAADIHDPAVQLRVWISLAEVAATAGDYGAAVAFAAEAETLARGFSLYLEQEEALAAVVETLAALVREIAASGDHDHAGEVAHDAEMICQDISNPFLQNQAIAAVYDAMVDLVQAVARDGELDRAESFAGEISNPYRQTEALAVLAREAAATGAYDRAAAWSGTVETTVRGDTDPDWQVRMLTILAAAAATAADTGRTQAVLDLADAIAHGVTYPREQVSIAAKLARAAAAAGDYSRAAAIVCSAEAIADRISDQYQRGDALVDLGKAAADLTKTAVEAGEHDHADTIARSITAPAWQAQVLKGYLRAATEAGDYDRATALAATIKTVAERITDPGNQVRALTGLAEAMTELAWAWAEAGDQDRAAATASAAEALALSITNLGDRALAWAELTRAVAATGDFDRTIALAAATETLARTISDPYRQAMTLVVLAEAVIATGDYDRAAALADLAGNLARDIAPESDRSWAQETIVKTTVGLAQKLAAVGGYESATVQLRSAEVIASSVSNPDSRRQALATLVQAVTGLSEAAAAAGDPHRARAIAQIITDPWEREHVMEGLARAAAATRAHAGVLAALLETLAQEISGPDHRVHTMCQLARAVAATGNYDRTATMLTATLADARTIADKNQKYRAIASVRNAEIGLIEVVAAAGDHDQAEALARSLDHPYPQVRALTVLARAVTASGDHARARTITSAAQEIAADISDPDNRAQALTLIVEAAVDARHIKELASAAASSADSITDPRWRAEAMASLARAVATTSDRSLAVIIARRAETLAHDITYVGDRINVLTGIAATMSAAGDNSRARQVARSVQELADAEDLLQQHRVRSKLLEMIAASSGYDLAESLITDIFDDPSEQTRYLAWLAKTACANGDIDDAEAIIRRISEPESRSRASAWLAPEVAAQGDIDRAEALAHSITHLDDQARAYTAIAEFAEPTRARSLAAFALSIGDWTLPLPVIARTDPAIVAIIADERVPLR